MKAEPASFMLEQLLDGSLPEQSGPIAGAAPDANGTTPRPEAGVHAQSSKGVPHDAIVFIPGLDEGLRPASLDHYARLIARGIQVNEPEYEWHVGPIRSEVFNPDCNLSARACEIEYGSGREAISRLTIYEMEYYDILLKSFRQRSLFSKSLILLLVILPLTLRFLRAIPRKGKAIKDKLQILLAGMLFFILVSYIILIVATAIGIVITSLSPQAYVSGPAPSQVIPAPAQTPPEASLAGDFWQQVRSWFGQAWELIISPGWRNLILVLTALGVVLPSRQQMRRLIEHLGGSLVAMILYLNFGERRNVLVGQIRDLLAFLAGKGSYSQIHVISYSVGTLITLDALMPPRTEVDNDEPGWLMPFHKISSLTTIGCPYDTLQVYWRDYFTGRYPLPPSLRQPGSPGWINIYSPDDILGSNFREDPCDKDPQAHWGIQTMQERPAGAPEATDTHGSKAEVPDRNLVWLTRFNPRRRSSLLDVITLIGLRAHSLYWEPAGDPQINCFDLFLSSVYGPDNPLMPLAAGNGTD